MGEIPENTKKITLAVIGTAGRKDDYDKLTNYHYDRMISAAHKVIAIEKITNLVSGGAAWADNVVCEIDLPKKIYLPSVQKDLETAKYYYDKFRAKISNPARYDLYGNTEIISGGGFLDRNLLVAKDADIFLAMTFGNDNEVKDGGTKHTVNAMLKQGKRGWHLNLNTLKLFCNAK